MRYVIAVALCLSAGVAHAQDMQRECAVQGDIVQAIAAQRIAGQAQRAAVRKVRDGLSEDGQKYAEVVPQMAEFVYTLVPQDQLGTDLANSWLVQCLAAAGSN